MNIVKGIDNGLLDRIVQIRKRTGLNQEDFYTKFIEPLKIKDLKSGNGKQGYMKKIENGYIDIPPELYLLYSKLGNCSIDALITGNDFVPDHTDQPPTYPEFIRCLDAIVSNELGFLLNNDEGKTALMITDQALINSIAEYVATMQAVNTTDSANFGQWLRKAWFDKELKKDYSLNKSGMLTLRAVRDFIH